MRTGFSVIIETKVENDVTLNLIKIFFFLCSLSFINSIIMKYSLCNNETPRVVFSSVLQPKGFL